MPSQRTRQTPSQQAIVRAVASSTAIETGQRVADVEAQLRHIAQRLVHPALALAFNRPAQPGPR